MAHALQSSSSDTFSSARGQREKLDAIDVCGGDGGSGGWSKGTVDGAHVAIPRQTTPHVVRVPQLTWVMLVLRIEESHPI